MPEHQLSQGWVISAIQNLISIDGLISDGDWIESKDQDPNGSIRLVQLADIGDGDFRNKSQRFMSEEKASLLNCTFLEEGDVLIARMPDPLGRACLFPGVGQPAVTVVDVCLIRAGLNSAITNHLLKYWINSPSFRGLISENASGTTRKRITRKKLEKFEIPLPPLAEQKVIADKLDTLLAQVENTKARLERIPQILKRFRQSVLAAAVSGRLTEEWRHNNPNTQHPDLAEIREYWLEQSRATGKKYLAPEPVTPSPGHRLPDSWVMTSIGRVFNVFVGSTPSRTREDYWNGDIPWVSSSEVAFCRITSTKEAITETGFSNASTTIHPVGTVMLAMIGQGRTRGQVAVLDIPACHNQNTAALRVPKEFVISDYLYYYLTQQYEETRRIGGGNNQKALNKRVVQSMDFPLAPFEEQTEIIRRVDQLFAHADRIEQQVNNALACVNNLTQSILAKAFRGELTQQWRKDNPALISGENSAEALLERIKTERAAMKKPAKKTRKQTTA